MGSYSSAPLRASAPRTHRPVLWVASTTLLSPWLCAVGMANDASPNATADVNATPTYSVRLSVINGGAPRDPELTTGQISQLPAGVSDPFSQKVPELDQARFVLRNDQDSTNDEQADASAPANNVLPIAGDFDGDGDAEFGIFRDGQWFIDLNGNGTWDQDDLWAQLGSVGDQPLVGDWDGDGKADIGVYGPQAAADVATVDSGLPDANNDAQVAKQNPDENTNRTTRPTRLIKQGAAGIVRVESVEFVQNLGTVGGVAIAGDFNGDGIDTVALFQDGHWTIDLNGDGQITAADLETNFGQAGDRPFAGDFNGDGSDEIGVYRDGHWAIATGDDGELRVTEFNFGGPNALPVVGDFDGDGRDESAVYR